MTRPIYRSTKSKDVVVDDWLCKLVDLCGHRAIAIPIGLVDAVSCAFRPPRCDPVKFLAPRYSISLARSASEQHKLASPLHVERSPVVAGGRESMARSMHDDPLATQINVGECPRRSEILPHPYRGDSADGHAKTQSRYPRSHIQP